MRHLLLLVLIAQGAAGVQRPPLPPSQTAQRLPFQKKEVKLKSPDNYLQRVSRTDAKTGEPIYYDPKPRVVLLDAKSGKYALKWIGYDGKEKTIVYQRPDAIDAVVSASVSKTDSSQYLYVYTVENLPSSGQYLSGFKVQNFASDVQPVKKGDAYIGTMNRIIPEFKEGNWISYGIPYLGTTVTPGRTAEFKVVSSAPPGLVGCRITGGALGYDGVGEHMPQELENVFLGSKVWPRGYTIGPVADLKTLSPTDRAKYIREKLPQFERLGWMTSSSFRWYEQNLQRVNLEQVLKRADQDLRSGAITTEVHSIIQAMQP